MPLGAADPGMGPPHVWVYDRLTTSCRHGSPIVAHGPAWDWPAAYVRQIGPDLCEQQPQCSYAIYIAV